MKLDELKRLSPKERIAKLKELEEQRKREITEARKMLSESVEELAVEEAAREQIPIDQLRAMDESMLQTREERELFRTKRFGAEKHDTPDLKIPQRKTDDPTPETAEERHERLEQIARTAPRNIPVKQYGSALSEVLTEVQDRYQNPLQAAKDAAYVLQSTAYDSGMAAEEKWKTYGDAKSLMSVLEQTGAPSDTLKYVANEVQKFVDRMKMHYRT